MRHVLKTDSVPFEDVWAGRKTFEIRRNDRGFEVGDELVLMETHKECEGLMDLVFTGRHVCARVTYALYAGYGVPDGFCIMSIVEVSRSA